METTEYRVESLIPYKELDWNPKTKLGTLNLGDSAWTIATKLGRYLLSDVKTELEVQKELAIECYCKLYGADRDALEPYDPAIAPSWGEIRDMEADVRTTTLEVNAAKERRLIANIANEADPSKKENAIWFWYDIGADCLVIAGQKDVKARYLGESHWHLHGDHRIKAAARGFRLPTALGALELCGDRTGLAQLATAGANKKHEWKDHVRYVRDENGSIIYDEVRSADGSLMGVSARREVEPNGKRAFFLEAAEERWGEEQVRSSMRRWASPDHTATVFEDKLCCDDAHRRAASRGFIGTHFGKVEVDQAVDLDEYAKLDAEFARRYSAGEIPAIDMAAHQMRFRKTLRHKAIGLYAPMLAQAPHHGIAVDVRSPKSLLHEFAHAYDFENGMLSMRAEFLPVRRAFEEGASSSSEKVSKKQWEYATTPTEVFARSWEVYAATRGIGGSFVALMDEYSDGRESWMYRALLDNIGLVTEYFDGMLEESAAA